ncbi:PgaD family protein [Herbaspirillum sp. YR522]|uniref:PgaD family protein n=1 Tax=Herbaspirillum sp. YR522 TaxID=1144342 RepID=UPI00026FA273|nr:PgaD family protein [Herbaspirillum sp. YR522]EJN07880.1 hypothetical protein PMI40_01633 [Herbaspirillum sp. YR522]
MTPELITHLDTSRHRWLRARDTVLLCSCWLVWGGMLMAVFHGGEWGALALSFKHWLLAQQIFFRSLMASLHVPMLYFLALAMLVAGFLLWSVLNLALAPHRRALRHSPLTTQELACHFNLDPTLIDAMQKEKRVLVFHALSGAVTDVRPIHGARVPAPAKA